MEDTRWSKVSKLQVIGFAVGLTIFGAAVKFSEPGFVMVLDHANLLFHEAGHPIIGLFSERLEPYGGTVGQLVFPVVLLISFWRKGSPLSLAGALVWLSENFWNIARYVADARTMELPLVGGGDHDWNTILGRWHLLRYDTAIAWALQILGWLGIAAACAWVGWRAWQDRHRIDDLDTQLNLPPTLPETSRQDFR